MTKNLIRVFYEFIKKTSDGVISHALMTAITGYSEYKKTGDVLSSQGQAQLFSPLKCLTSEFGMYQVFPLRYRHRIFLEVDPSKPNNISSFKTS